MHSKNLNLSTTKSKLIGSGMNALRGSPPYGDLAGHEKVTRQGHFFLRGFRYLVSPWNHITSAGFPWIWMSLF